MITVRGIITLLVLAVLFALAVVWISRQGGWKGEGIIRAGAAGATAPPATSTATPPRRNTEHTNAP